MADTRYTSDHEYIRVENEFGTIGISEYAQDKLGDIVFVELPARPATQSPPPQANSVSSSHPLRRLRPMSQAIAAICGRG
jgi:glycine cleavage system H protein